MSTVFVALALEAHTLHDPVHCTTPPGTPHRLSSLQRVELWAEGAVGKVHLELKSVSAVPAAPHPNSTPLLTVSSPAALAAAAAPAAATTASRTATRPPAPFGTCSGAVQKQLRFGISGREQPTVPVPLPATESLAEAVCCDNRTVACTPPPRWRRETLP